MGLVAEQAASYEAAARAAPSGAVEAAARLLRLSREPVAGVLLARAMTGLADIAGRLDRRALGEAAGEPTNLGALLRVLEHPGAADLLAGDDPLADARLRWIRDRARLLSAEGRPLPSCEVATLLGISRQAVAKARADGRLVGLPTGSRAYVYPAWQFGPGGPLGGLRDVRRALGDDPWTLTAFVVAPNSRLDGETPLAALRRGELAAVLGAARAYGEQGAA